jgi:hypothetical protein
MQGAPKEARYAALRELGGMEQIKEDGEMCAGSTTNAFCRTFITA